MTEPTREQVLEWSGQVINHEWDARNELLGLSWRQVYSLCALAYAAGAKAKEEELLHAKIVEARLAAVVRWLEVNQPDVFKRGLWDAIGEADRGLARRTT